ncbi:uncharacterized protein LOC126847868 isoform X2 [Adelges cooleyi]|uniref:uncharacterized protein LOC126847868 isoform X2 n=1 Tax=Adelges cooleyi TaxID=133065 RepID=UPI00217FA8CC|nr:uncharacterized protein LOC126847868 isoform X2 [Adelges cooleyi]
MKYKREVFITNEHIKLAYQSDTKTNSLANGLECVIKTIIEELLYKIESMNNMINVPEYLFENDVQGSIDLQGTMQVEINAVLKIDVPDIDENQNFEKLDLFELGEERRCLTRKALKNIFIHKIGFRNLTALTEERRLHTTEKIRNKIANLFNGKKPQEYLLKMCTLVALCISAKSSKLYITFLQITNTGDCILTDTITPYKTYREIKNIWWQIKVNDTSDEIPVLELL